MHASAAAQEQSTFSTDCPRELLSLQALVNLSSPPPIPLFSSPSHAASVFSISETGDTRHRELTIRGSIAKPVCVVALDLANASVVASYNQLGGNGPNFGANSVGAIKSNHN